MKRYYTWIAMLVLGWPALSGAQSSLPFVFHSGATATGNGTVMQADYFSSIHVQVGGTFGSARPSGRARIETRSPATLH